MTVQGKFTLEQICGQRHKDKPNNPRQDSSLNYPYVEATKEIEITEILEPDPGATNVSLDEIEWLLVSTSAGQFKLFIRDYPDIEDQPPEDNNVKVLYPSVLHYELPGDSTEDRLVWPVQIKDLERMASWYKSRWKRLAVLAICKKDNDDKYSLQALCRPPYSEAGFCEAYCRPIPKSGYEKKCGLYCPISPPP